MSDEKNLAQAKEVFETLCRMLDKNEWKYDKNEEKLSIECGVQGDDIPIKLTVNVDVQRKLVLLFSHIPFVVQEDKKLDVAIAVSIINNRLVDGSFDYNVATGHMFFRMTNSFLESIISEDVLSYMVFCSCRTIDDYNDKLLMIAKGMMTIEQFISSMSNQ